MKNIAMTQILSSFLAFISIIFFELEFRTKPDYIGFSMVITGLSIFGLSVVFSYILFEKKLINLFLVCFSYIGYCFIFERVLYNRNPIKSMDLGMPFFIFGVGMILLFTAVMGILLGMEMKNKKIK